MLSFLGAGSIQALERIAPMDTNVTRRKGLAEKGTLSPGLVPAHVASHSVPCVLDLVRKVLKLARPM